ncbi:MAG: FMN-binding negative transcriptional regulator [Pseudomonadota bacterium]
MHPNPAFRGVDAARNLAFARERSFGVLTVVGDDAPLISHIPFVLAEDGEAIMAHIVKSNPIWRALRDGPRTAAMIVSGPDAYVSPDWYGVDDQVPTWNYVAVHLRGEVRLADEAGMRAHADELSGQFEARLAPKPIWKTEKMDEEALHRMMRMIAPIEMTIESVDGTWKLGQNKADEARQGAVEGMKTSEIGSEIASLAALMADPPA